MKTHKINKLKYTWVYRIVKHFKFLPHFPDYSRIWSIMLVAVQEIVILGHISAIEAKHSPLSSSL